MTCFICDDRGTYGDGDVPGCTWCGKVLGAVPDDLFAGLTPDEVRVITGLVTAMRESVVEARNALRGEDACESLGLADGALLEARQGLNWLPPDEVVAVHAASDAAWHIAHAIAQMGES